MGTSAEVDWSAVAAIGTLLAVAAAIGTPYVAARIDQKRKRRSAVRLAALSVEAIRLLATYRGAAGNNAIAAPEGAARSTNLAALLARMESTPSVDIGQADDLEAFVRIAALGHEAVRLAKGTSLTVDEATRMLNELPIVCDEAINQLARLRRH